MKRLYMIRHCNAEGQHRDSPLTKNGVKQAQIVSSLMEESNVQIDRIVSSPFLRAVETINPYARNNSLAIEMDTRLQERLLSEEPIDDWMDVLEQSFTDFDFRLPGGESSNDALNRAYQVVNEVMNDDTCENAILVTHGNLLAILLKEFRQDIGFNQWKEFSNPDIYLVERIKEGYTVEHLWH